MSKFTAEVLPAKRYQWAVQNLLTYPVMPCLCSCAEQTSTSVVCNSWKLLQTLQKQLSDWLWTAAFNSMILVSFLIFQAFQTCQKNGHLIYIYSSYWNTLQIEKFLVTESQHQLTAQRICVTNPENPAILYHNDNKAVTDCRLHPWCCDLESSKLYVPDQ